MARRLAPCPTDAKRPVALLAAEAPPRPFRTNYPEPFASRMAGRDKRPLGDLFGLTNFGVNITRLAPGGSSALRHAHTKQDEFVYILEGRPTLVTDAGRTVLQPGMCAGFKAGSGDAHCLVNETGEDVVYLEIGDRTAGDAVDYPDDDLAVRDGRWQAADGAQRRHAVLSDDDAAGLSVRRAARRRKQADGSASSRGKKSFRSVAPIAPKPRSQPRWPARSAAYFQLTGRALRQHKPHPIRLGQPGAFSSARP